MSDDRKLKDEIVTTDPAIWRDKATALLAKIKGLWLQYRLLERLS